MAHRSCLCFRPWLALLQAMTGKAVDGKCVQASAQLSEEQQAFLAALLHEITLEQQRQMQHHQRLLGCLEVRWPWICLTVITGLFLWPYCRGRLDCDPGNSARNSAGDCAT